MKSKYDNWHTSPFLKWDSRHYEAIEKLIKLGLFSTRERAFSYLRSNSLNPIPMLNHFLKEHDCYFLGEVS